jgi:spermidine/putrescine transport system ATP-binding protein
MSDVKVQLKNLVKEFPSKRGEEAVRAVNEINLNIYDGEFFALLGPSGCGKTTTLRLIAGFEQPTSGEVIIDGQQVAGVPAFKRPVNTVFQDYVLFPHMTVLQNVAFGLKMAGINGSEAHKRAQEALELVQLPHVGKRRPSELSGGQQQRIALARALVNQPSVLLLDEPLGALDLKLRRQMQIELKTMQAELGITFIFVTHDQEEAMTMANRIAVMQGGHVLQVGRPEEVYETPQTRFVADFIGETNFLEGKLTAYANGIGQVNITDDITINAIIPDKQTVHNGQNVSVAIRPERLSIYPVDAQPVSDPQVTVVRGQVIHSNYIGTDTRYMVRIGSGNRGGDLTVRVQNTDYKRTLDYKPNEFVNLVWDNTSARILTQ